jgi:hypothetical protein
MASKELVDVIERLSQGIEDARSDRLGRERNEEWTKANLIYPLLDGLGWNTFTDVAFEAGHDDNEERVDLILTGPCRIAIEAKKVDVSPPEALTTHRS